MSVFEELLVPFLCLFVSQFYLTERCYKNIIERPSYMCKIRQINKLVKLYFATYILERLSIMWLVGF